MRETKTIYSRLAMVVLALVLIGSGWFTGCAPFGRPVSERVQFADAHHRPAWLKHGDIARDNPLRWSLPHAEQSTFIQPLGVQFSVPEGFQARLEIEPAKPGESPAFLELFEPGDLSSNDESGEFQLRLQTSRAIIGNYSQLLGTGDYVALLQAHPGSLRSFNVDVILEPELLYPISGSDRVRIGSPFGAPRDGGRRSHHGVDLFAARNTPILAARDGVITRVGNGGLGGLHIWQRDDRGRRLYYAHLETTAVRAGQAVTRGQPIGGVGNSGNARHTPPHLHFGVYQRMSGPIDPSSWLGLDQRATVAEFASESARVVAASLNLRAGPGTDHPVIGKLNDGAQVLVLGSGAGWVRVAADGRTGYVSSRFLATI